MDGTEVAQLRKKKVADLMYQTDIVKIRRNMPLIQTPLSRFAETWGTFQNSNCGELELDYVRCVSRIGQQEAAINPLCMKYQDDLNECLYRRKTVARYEAMQAERKRQGKFEEPPPKDYIRIQRDVTT